jgi:hypothetical protein
MRPVILVLALASALALAGPARGDCPISLLYLGCRSAEAEPATTPTARYGGGTWTAGTACPGACYDGPNGTLHAEFAPSIHDNPKSCIVDLVFADDYQLVGGTPGMSYPCEARLLAAVAIADTGGVVAVLDDAANPAGGVGKSWNRPGPAAGSIVLPLVLIAGQPIRLEAELLLTGFPAGNVTANAVLRFAGLPQGVSVTSCRAYDLPVPAATATWGRLKATYR